VDLTIRMPDDLVLRLEAVAAAQRKSIQELALEQLSSLVGIDSGPRLGSPAVVLQEMREAPHLSVSDVEELDKAIMCSRLPIRTRDLFS